MGAPRSAVKALIGGYISPQEGNKSSHTLPHAEYSSDGDASDYRTDVDHESGSDEEDNHVEDELEENETCLRKALSKGRKGSGAPCKGSRWQDGHAGIQIKSRKFKGGM